jgi:hypothetical protein
MVKDKEVSVILRKVINLYIIYTMHKINDEIN